MVSFSQSTFPKSSPLFLEGLWTYCGHCGVSSDSSLALLQFVLTFKVHNWLQSPQYLAHCEDPISCTAAQEVRSLPFLWSQALVFLFGFGPTSAYRLPRNICSLHKQEGAKAEGY